LKISPPSSQTLRKICRPASTKRILDIVENAPSFFYGRNYRGELSSVKNLSADSFATSVPVMPIDTPMFAALKRERR
jgi:hypothetical protein